MLFKAFVVFCVVPGLVVIPTLRAQAGHHKWPWPIHLHANSEGQLHAHSDGLYTYIQNIEYLVGFREFYAG